MTDEQIDSAVDELGASVQRIFEACCTQADLGTRASDASKLSACQEASAGFAHSVNAVLELDKSMTGSSEAVQLQSEHDKLAAELKDKVRGRACSHGRPAQLVAICCCSTLASCRCKLRCSLVLCIAAWHRRA